jgi:hypothetical protein
MPEIQGRAGTLLAPVIPIVPIGPMENDIKERNNRSANQGSTNRGQSLAKPSPAGLNARVDF